MNDNVYIIEIRNLVIFVDEESVMKAPSIALPAAASPERAPRRLRSLPDLHAIEAFVAVCDAGSMSHAAHRLDVSQSAVSQLIRSLERDYGVLLFDRDVRPARPTHAGRMLERMGSDLIDQARSVGQTLRQRVRQEHAEMRLGCVDSFAATLGPAIVRGLSGAARHLQMTSGLTPALSAQLQARELDIAICTDSSIEDPRITQRPLFSEAWVAVFPKGTVLRPLRTVADLKVRCGALPMVRYSPRSVIGQQIERFLRHAGVDAERRFDFDTTEPLLSLVAAGLGWAISTPLCLWQSRGWLKDVQLLAMPPSHLGRRDFFVYCREAEWASMADEVVRLTRSVLQSDIMPAMKDSMPMLANDAVAMASRSTPRGGSLPTPRSSAPPRRPSKRSTQP